MDSNTVPGGQQLQELAIPIIHDGEEMDFS
jgi:hypothetical protein